MQYHDSRPLLLPTLFAAAVAFSCADHDHVDYSTGASHAGGAESEEGGASGQTTGGQMTGGQTAGGSSSGGAAGGNSSGGSVNSARSCDDLGPEPTIPPACSTLTATRVATDGVLDDESTLDTLTIQAAIDACPAGQAVRLTADGDNNAFLSGPLFLKEGMSLWVDTGVTLFASRDPREFDAKPDQCGTSGGGSSACFGLVNARNVRNAGLIGAGTLDGRGGEPVQNDTRTWWELEDEYDGKLAAPRLVQTTRAHDFTLYGVRLQNASKFHVVIEGSIGFRVWGIEIDTPADAPNTDGVDPAASTNGIIAYNRISTGDDNIAIKGGGPTTVDNLVIAHNHFGRGHGMSIGSETNGGVRNVRICDLSLDGTDNGLRIKSDATRGGLVQNISYTGVCIRGVKNPLVFDPYYSSGTGTLIPNFRDIEVSDVHVLGGGRLTFTGFDQARPLTISLDNVIFDSPPTFHTKTANAELVFGPGAVNFVPTGNNVIVVDRVTAPAQPRNCDDAF
ncbi:MAG TPA: glycosyl hydrolase family 28 protein [Polyangiaceae bacterium]|nr:glycosyl hydrolase family 28 protein [Polyangiaceae bacterium]